MYLRNGTGAYRYMAPCGTRFNNRSDALASAEARMARAALGAPGDEGEGIAEAAAESDDEQEEEDVAAALQASIVEQALRSGKQVAATAAARGDESEWSDDEEEDGIGRCMIWGCAGVRRGAQGRVGGARGCTPYGR